LVHERHVDPPTLEKVIAMEPQWQPIETAPSDGRAVLVYRGNYDQMIVMREADGEWWRMSGDLRGTPTHWMPLPPPPPTG
jgi:hypothetical protein